MLTVQFGNFSKRKNSTARPASLAASFSVALKENTSYDNPTFKLTAAAFDYNYCKWDNRYYFVVDIISERNNGWSVVCELDLMATYRDYIHDTTAFIEYAAAGNTQIVDQRLGVEYGVAGVKSAAAGSPIKYLENDLNDVGHFITVIGQQSADTFYIQPDVLRYLFDQMQTWIDSVVLATDTISAIATGFRQLLASGSAAECVRDAYVLPIVAPLDVLDSASHIYLGMYDTLLNGNKVTGAGNVVKTVEVAIPHQYGDWRKQSPYEMCSLALPLYGTIDIPSDIAADCDALSVKGILNVRSGDYTYYISGAGRPEREIVVGGNCAAPLAIGASNITMGNAVHAGLSMGQNLMLGNALGAAASLSALSPVPHSIGQAGGISNRITGTTCIIYYRNTSDNIAAASPVQGIPLQATRRLGNLSGYVQTRGASVSGPLHGEQYDRVNATLDSGAFIE